MIPDRVTPVRTDTMGVSTHIGTHAYKIYRVDRCCHGVWCNMAAVRARHK